MENLKVIPTLVVVRRWYFSCFDFSCQTSG